ncbi:MAG: hypothetical protein ACTSVE_09675 [Candidatus Helarchaeota archaeon]
MAKSRKKIFSFILLCMLLMNIIVFTVFNSLTFTSNLRDHDFNNGNLNDNYVEDPSFYNDYHKYYYDFDKNLTPLQILTVIRQDYSSFFDEFAMLASIPYNIFVDDQLHKVAPIIYDDLNNNTRQFLNEWNKYNNYFGGIKRIIYVGDVQNTTRAEIETLTDYDASDKSDRPPLNFTDSNIYDLAASFASSFWTDTNKIILAVAPESEFTNSINILPVINDTISPNGQFSITGILSSTGQHDLYYNSSNVTMIGGAFLIKTNTTNNLDMELIGNYSQPSRWVFDTTNFTNNNWVFIPNLTYPANSSDWALHIFNSSNLTSDIPYNLTFYNMSANFHDLKVNSSNANISISLTWSDPLNDLDLWVINPKGQLISYSDRNGFEYNESHVNETSEVVSLFYPEVGDWQVIITGNNNSSNTDYDLQYTVTNFSRFKENITISAANAAVIGSILHDPLLYTNGTYFTNATKNFINTRNTTSTIDVIIVDLNNSIDIDSLNQSLTTHFSDVIYLNDTNLVSSLIFNLTGLKNTTLASINEDQYAAAAVYSAFKGNLVLPSFIESNNFLFDARSNYKIMENGYYQSPLRQHPSFENMSTCSNEFYNWLDLIQSSPNNKSISIFSSPSELYPTLDRAIMGKARVGRFPSQLASNNLIDSQTSNFYPLFSYVNKSDALDTLFLNAQIIDADFQDDDSIISGMSTDNWQLTSHFIDWLKSNDSIYVSAINDSNGLYPCIGINLSSFDLNLNNITSIDIIMRASIDTSNSSINKAGWAIWNWTENNYSIINDTIFNSTSFQDDSWSYSGNMSHVINMTENGRLEVFFIANQTNLSHLIAKIDLLKINITFKGEFAKQFALFSNISSSYNFTFNQTETHNYSIEFPNTFLSQGYNSTNSTEYNNVIGNLSNKFALWYHSGEGLIENLNFEDVGNFSFNNGNTWKSGTNFLMELNGFNSCITLLDDDYLGSTKIPEIFLSLGSSSVISNLGKNLLGYSEQMFRDIFQEILQGKSLGDALISGLNETSHLYSLNDLGNVIENTGDPSNSEDYHQYILFGDPDQKLVRNSSFLIKPGNYKPIVSAKSNYTYRKTTHTTDIHNYEYSNVYFNLIDIDSKIVASVNNFEYKINPGVTEISALQFGYTSADIDGVHYNFVAQLKLGADGANPAQLGLQNAKFTINDGVDQIILYPKINVLSDAPIFWQYYGSQNYNETFIPDPIDYNTNNISNFLVQDENGYHFLPYNTIPEIGRKNETFHAYVVVGDLDWQDIDPPPGSNTQLFIAVNVCLKHKETGTWINLTAQINQTVEQFDGDGENSITSPHGRSKWYVNYTFKESDHYGLYDIYVQSFDTAAGHGMAERTQKVEFINITAFSWPVELNFSQEFPNGFKNNSAIVWRLNETLQINATFFDRDDYDPFGQVTSDLHVEGNDTINSVQTRYNSSFGDFEDTFYDDSQYHIFSNDSNGLIIIPYFINLTNQGMNFDNITSFNITAFASISYSNENISYAGWKIWNWTSNDFYEISNNSFNDTQMTSSFFNYSGNLSNFINKTENNRLEIFFFVNTTQNSTLNLSIDYIRIEVINNRTGIQASLCLKHNATGTTYWINKTMTYYQVNRVWNTTYVFTNENLAGTWYIYFQCTDKDGFINDIFTGRNITVLNHLPNNLNLTLLSNSSVYRTANMIFHSNATDFDVYNRSANLTFVLFFHSFLANVTFNETMTFNETLGAWNITWCPPASADLGNYSVNLTVFDETGEFNSTMLGINITVLNNFPNITLVQFIPDDFVFLENEIIKIVVNFTDIEGLLNYTVKIKDYYNNWKNLSAISISQTNTSVVIELDPDFYSGLIFYNNWTIYIFVSDADYDLTNFSISIRVIPQPIPPPPLRFPWELIVILGLVITAVFASLLVYKFRQKEEEEVPVSRVKAIIKRISEERIAEEERERELIAEYEKKELFKKHGKVAKKQKEKRKGKAEPKELDKLEIKNLEVRLSETLASARAAIKKSNFRYAGDLYQRAAKIASRLGNVSKSTRFSEQAESCYKKARKTRK